MYKHIKVPSAGQKISVNADFSLNVPDQPIIPFIEGDGTGFDITPVMIKVVDAAVAKAYGGKKKIHWMEVYAGEKATKVYGPDVWFPTETLDALRDYVVSIKGPLTTPIGGGIRSLNVFMRQELDLYVCLRPIQYFEGVPWCKFKSPKTGKEIIVKDCIADAFLQQILLRPAEYSVIATLNLNGDYISDALAAQVGGIGIAAGANLSDSVACFEATHGTAPKYAGKDYVNPGSEILSAEMMLRHMGWTEAADAIINSMQKSIKSKKVTYDFARLMEGATQVSCSGFGQVMIDNM